MKCAQTRPMTAMPAHTHGLRLLLLPPQSPLQVGAGVPGSVGCDGAM